MYEPNLPSIEPRTVIVRLQPGDTKRLLVVGHELVAVQTHWTSRTRLCPGPEQCPACYSGVQARWIGYVPVRTPNHQDALLELTVAGGESWRGWCSDGDLYNQVITVRRSGKHGATVLVSIEQHSAPPTRDVGRSDVLDQLCRLLALPRRRSCLDEELWKAAVESAAIVQLRLDLQLATEAS